MKSLLSVVSIIILVGCVNASSFIPIESVGTSSNGIVYVSAGGTDTGTCGATNTTACRTIAYAYEHSTTPRDVRLLDGTYAETQPITIGASQSLTITGQNQTGCFLSKNADGIILFRLEQTNANLTLINLTLSLTNNSEAFNYITSSSDVVVFINFSSVRITEQTGVSQIYGDTIIITNSLATLAFINCTAFTINSTNKPFIHAYRLKTLYMKDSSFANIQNNNINGSGGCFYTESTKNLTLIRCTFSSCLSGNSGGVGYVYYLQSEGALIDTCTFTNSTATNYGVMHVVGDGTFTPTVNIFNTSCVKCTASAGGGGAFSFTRYAKPNVSWCSFSECASQGTGTYGGGGLSLVLYCVGTVDRCTFLNCSGQYGSAIYVFDMSSVVLSNSVLMNNSVGGSHVHANNSANVSVSNSFSDGNPALYCNETGGTFCNGSFQNRAIYLSPTVTCATTFNASTPIDGYCNMPCSASNGMCAKPDACAAEHVSANGLCIPTCSYWVPQTPQFGVATCGTNCAVDNTRGFPLCVIECTRRLRNTSALFPCGSSDCYYDSAAPANAGQQCLLNCVANIHHTGEGVDGVCTLRNCTQRLLNDTAAHPCGGPGCYLNPTARSVLGEQCITACTADGFRTGTVTNETCTLRNCTDRTSAAGNSSIPYACGTVDCFYDENQTAQAGKKCVVACAASHYREENSNATCQLKDCQYRLRNSTATLPCATADCLFDPAAATVPGLQCIRNCPTDVLHTGANASGVCTMIPCNQRLRNATGVYPCGSDDCYYDPAAPAEAGLQCISNCTADNVHSGVVANGTCLLKTCIERTANMSATPPCGGVGGDCYYDPTAPAVAGMQCLTNCTENHQLNGVQQNMTCLLKACPQRLQNASTIFPCGTVDCYYDTLAPSIVGQQCGLACDVSGFQPDTATGICVKKEVKEDPAAAKSAKNAKTGLALGIVALVLAVIALAAIVALIIYCCICGKGGGYSNVDDK